MKTYASTIALLFSANLAQADACQERFAQLLIDGNAGFSPTRMEITQEIVGGDTSVTLHYDMGDGTGMGEAVDPPTNPWTLFVNDKMYMSHDKGTTWGFVTDFDGAKGRADNKAAMTKDATTARDLTCKEDMHAGALHETVEGSYTSSLIAGATITEKLWINPETGMIVQSYRHVKSAGFETKTTQVVSLYPELTLPKPE